MISRRAFIYNFIKSRKPGWICHRLEKFFIYSSRAVIACSPLGIIPLQQKLRCICGRGRNEDTALKQAQGGCRMAEQCRLVAFGYKEKNRDSRDSWYTWQYNMVKADFVTVNRACKYKTFLMPCTVDVSYYLYLSK